MLNKVIQLLFASGFNVVLSMLVSVYNTRCLAPEHYGDVRFVNNMISFISGFLLFGFFISGSRLIALEKDHKKIREIKGLLLIILSIAILILMVCTAILCGSYCFFNKRNIALLFAVAIPVCSSVLLTNYINTVAPGDNRITILSVSRILPHLLYLIVAYIVYSTLGATSSMMIILMGITNLIVIVPMIVSEKPLFRNVKDNLDKLKKENSSYGFQVYLGAIFGVSFGYLGGVTLGLFNADNTQVGYYTLAVALAGPMSLVPTTVGTVFFRDFSNSDYISSKVLKSTFFLTILGFIGFVIVICPAVSILYKPEYHVVARYAAWLALGTCLNGAGDFFNRFLSAHGQGKTIRNAAIACGAILGLGNIFFVYFWGITGAILTRNFAYLVYFAFIFSSYIKYRKVFNSSKQPQAML